MAERWRQYQFARCRPFSANWTIWEEIREEKGGGVDECSSMCGKLRKRVDSGSTSNEIRFEYTDSDRNDSPTLVV